MEKTAMIKRNQAKQIRRKKITDQIIKAPATLVLLYMTILSAGACVTEYKKTEEVPADERPGAREKSQKDKERVEYHISQFQVIENWKTEDRSVPFVLAPYPERPPESFQLKDLPAPGFQGIQSSGTAWAAGYAAMTHLMHLKYPEEPTYICSPAYIYNRLNEGKNRGVEILEALELLKEEGCPDIKYMPYYPEDYVYSPSAEARINASRYKIDHYGRVDYLDVRQVEAHLLENRVVIANLKVYENFVSLQEEVWKKPGGRFMGRHTVAVIGFDRKNRRFLVMNSAGKNWGENGRFQITYEWFIRLANQAYVIW